MHPPRQWYSAAAATRAVLVAFGTTSSNTRYCVLGSDLYCIFAYLRHSQDHTSGSYTALTRTPESCGSSSREPRDSPRTAATRGHCYLQEL